MATYNISLNDELARIVDIEIKEKKYSSRSEFFRDLVRQKYVTHEDRHDIETLSSADPDVMIIQDRKNDASFVPLNNLLRP
ncbi:ribbon-helix-helix protein, CopG family [Candidatus Uhrbacteria bacterium]|nr:ribbon-helix-helix protein, CopG family [Candidatus Uhrbacteria bacterium]